MNMQHLFPPGGQRQGFRSRHTGIHPALKYRKVFNPCIVVFTGAECDRVNAVLAKINSTKLSQGVI